MAEISDTTFASMPASVQPARPAFSIAVGASPFVYTAPQGMAVLLSGGAVSLVSYSRGGASLGALGLTSGITEMNAGDSLTVTWAITKPAMTGIPRN